MIQIFLYERRCQEKKNEKNCVKLLKYFGEHDDTSKSLTISKGSASVSIGKTRKGFWMDQRHKCLLDNAFHTFFFLRLVSFRDPRLRILYSFIAHTQTERKRKKARETVAAAWNIVKEKPTSSAKPNPWLMNSTECDTKTSKQTLNRAKKKSISKFDDCELEQKKITKTPQNIQSSCLHSVFYVWTLKPMYIFFCQELLQYLLLLLNCWRRAKKKINIHRHNNEQHYSEEQKQNRGCEKKCFCWTIKRNTKMYYVLAPFCMFRDFQDIRSEKWTP